MGRLDLSGYTDQVRSVAGGAGRPAFDPQLLVSLWVYSYSQSVSSARAIERLCEHHPAYQWLTGMQSISAHTLSDFRVTRVGSNDLDRKPGPGASAKQRAENLGQGNCYVKGSENGSNSSNRGRPVASTASW